MGFQPGVVAVATPPSPQALLPLLQNSTLVPRDQAASCLPVTLRLTPPIYMVCVCISLLLFTFSFVENTENHSETPAAPVPPPPALPKPKPKPKPKKTPVPPKGAAAGAGPKGDEVPPSKKNIKAPGKQAPVPPPKPTSRNTIRETGEYAPPWGESRVLGLGVGLLISPSGDAGLGDWCLWMWPWWIQL